MDRVRIKEKYSRKQLKSTSKQLKECKAELIKENKG
jgi:hypothetical protein